VLLLRSGYWLGERGSGILGLHGPRRVKVGGSQAQVQAQVGYGARDMGYFWGRLAFIDSPCTNMSVLGIYFREYHSIKVHIF